MHIIESIVNWMVNGEEKESTTPRNDTSADARNDTQPQQARQQQQIGMISHPQNSQSKPSYRQTSQQTSAQEGQQVRNERWNPEDFGEGVSSNPRPVYRPPYDNHDGHVHSRDDPPAELPENIRRLYQDYEPRVRSNLRAQSDSETPNHPNPWGFPTGDADGSEATSPRGSESQLNQQSQPTKPGMGSAFDFEMGERPAAESSTARPSGSRSARRPEPIGADAHFTPQQISRAPYGVFDRNGNCRCPSHTHEYF